jgi:CDP-glucose 4,6-dehydratase
VEGAGNQPYEGTFPETHFLHLDSSKARGQLGWQSALDFADAVTPTAEWYREFYARPWSAAQPTAAQINRYRQQL